jgi:carbon-monoxide dehydrogenase small subunit
MTTKVLRLNVNGEDAHVPVGPMATLQDVLRDKLELTSVKVGCAQGGCGSCSVLIDGELRLACLTPAEAVDGCAVVTLEGLNESNSIVPIQQSFIENYAAQCGFCTSGMLVATKALLESNPAPSRDEILAALSGNLCRCTGYLPIIKAVEDAAAALSGKKSA